MSRERYPIEMNRIDFLMRSTPTRQAAKGIGRDIKVIDGSKPSTWGARIMSRDPLPFTKYYGSRPDITGKRFGRLMVLGIFIKKSKVSGVRWVVRCDCGYHTTRHAKTLGYDNGLNLMCESCKRLEILRHNATIIPTDQPEVLTNKHQSNHTSIKP